MKTVYAKQGDDLQILLDGLNPLDTLMLPKGVFRQKLEINVPNVTVVGAGANETVLVYGDYAKMKDELGREITTFKTQTLTVCADGVKLCDLAVCNDADNPEIKGQEVALYVIGDRFTATNCVFTSTQDTLFCGPLPDDLVLRYDGFLADKLRYREGECRQVYRNCTICGTVDFIFGCGTALFDNCKIVSRSDVRKTGYVAAPAHSLKQTLGFFFYRCEFYAEKEVEEQSVYLARPWRDFGLCIFAECVYGKHITETGFDKWNDTSRDRTARFYEFPHLPCRAEWSKPLSREQALLLPTTFKRIFDF